MKLLKLKNPITSQEYDMIFIIINKFTKWGYFIIYTEEISAENVVQTYIKKIFAKHGVLVKIILNRDTRFIIAF